MNKFFSVGLLLAVMPGAACGQGIHTGPLTWLAQEDLPDELPVPRGVPKPAILDAQKAAHEPAYAQYHVFVSPKGQANTWGGGVSSPWLPHEAQSFYRDFVPARRDGEAVACDVVICHIFNPADADAKAADAIPRLLAVHPARYPEGDDKEDGNKQLNVRVRATINEQGKVTEVGALSADRPDCIPPALAAVRLWQFAPARKQGQAIAASLDFNVIMVKSSGVREGQKIEAPRPLNRTTPAYPMALRRAGYPGEVEVGFFISVEGRVVEPAVLFSSHPSFEDAALEALRSWRFKPAQVEGRAVVAAVRQTFQFSMEDGTGAAGSTVTPPKNWPADLPADYRFESPPRLLRLEAPVYPCEDLQAGHEGKVIVVFVVDRSGHTTQVAALPGGTASPAMAAAAVAAVECYTFQPAARQGAACLALLRFEFEFDTDGTSGHVPVTEGTRRALRALESGKLVKVEDLDAKPEVRTSSNVQSPLRGTVLLDFVVDRDGIPRLPRFDSSADPKLGYAAVQALSTWRFKRPMSHGKFVDVRVRLPLEVK
jgi:TonB family protein